MLSASDVKQAGLAVLANRSLPDLHWPPGPLFEQANGLVAIVDWEPSDEFNAQDNEQRALMVLNIAAFWEPQGALNYTLDLLMKADLDESVALQKTWLDRFAEAEGPVAITGGGTDIEVALADDEELEINYMDALEVHNGERRSIADMFEVSLEHDVTERPEGRVFTVDGTFQSSALAVATGRRLQNRDMRYAEGGLQLLRQVADSGATLEIEANLVRSFKVGTSEKIDVLADLVGAEPQHVEVLESAVGTNRAVLAGMDPYTNAQVNEGVLGFHIGIGEGMTGAHLDFLCPYDWTKGAT